jgi:hypothetical protein
MGDFIQVNLQNRGDQNSFIILPEFLFNTPSEFIRSVDSNGVKKSLFMVSFHIKLAALNDLIKNTFNL